MFENMLNNSQNLTFSAYFAACLPPRLSSNKFKLVNLALRKSLEPFTTFLTGLKSPVVKEFTRDQMKVEGIGNPFKLKKKSLFPIAKIHLHDKKDFCQVEVVISPFTH